MVCALRAVRIGFSSNLFRPSREFFWAPELPPAPFLFSLASSSDFKFGRWLPFF